MDFFHKLLANSFLIFVLFVMLLLPFGVVGLSGIKQQNQVLSEQDIRVEDGVMESTEVQDPRYYPVNGRTPYIP